MQGPWFDSWSGSSSGEGIVFLGFPSSSNGKESTCNVGDLGSIPGLGRSPGGGHGKPLQYPCLENSYGQEPGGLHSMDSQRVGHDWATKHTVQATIYRQSLSFSNTSLPSFVSQAFLCTCYSLLETVSLPFLKWLDSLVFRQFKCHHLREVFLNL